MRRIFSWLDSAMLSRLDKAFDAFTYRPAKLVLPILVVKFSEPAPTRQYDGNP